MNLRWLTYLMMICSLCAAACADVVFVGPPPSNKKALERQAQRNTASVDSLKALLSDAGYLDAGVSVERDRYTIEAGLRSTIEKIIWSGVSPDTISLRLPFTRETIEAVIEDRLGSYQRDGYFYASATITQLSRQGTAVTIDISINPGPMLPLEDAVYTGLVRTRPEMIDRYILLTPGEPLSESIIREAEREARSIPFVDFNPPATIRPKPGYTGADLEFVFSEKRQALFSGGGGYVPDNSTSFVWDLNLRFQNFFGGGRQIDLKSERREQDRQILDIAYRQPVFFFGVGEASFNVATRDYRDRFYEFALNTGYTARLSTDFSAGIGFGWRSIEPSDNMPSYSSFSSSFTIERDNIDNPLNPVSGLSVTWTITYGYRRYSDDSLAIVPQRTSFNETRNSVSIHAYRPLGGPLVGQASFGYVGLETNESLPPLAELYYIGGPGTIRGYRNEQFTAVRSAYGGFEPRLRFDSGYMFVFYEGAYVNNRVSDNAGGVRTDEFYRSSYGLGAAIIDAARSVKISLGWNPDSSFDQPRLSLEFSSEI